MSPLNLWALHFRAHLLCAMCEPYSFNGTLHIWALNIRVALCQLLHLMRMSMCVSLSVYKFTICIRNVCVCVCACVLVSYCILMPKCCRYIIQTSIILFKWACNDSQRNNNKHFDTSAFITVAPKSHLPIQWRYWFDRSIHVDRFSRFHSQSVHMQILSFLIS